MGFNSGFKGLNVNFGYQKVKKATLQQICNSGNLRKESDQVVEVFFFVLRLSDYEQSPEIVYFQYC